MNMDQVPDGWVAVKSVMQGTVVDVRVAEGEQVYAGQSVVVVEAMKMQHLIKANVSGVVRKMSAAVGVTFFEGQSLLFVEPMEMGNLEKQAEDDG